MSEVTWPSCSVPSIVRAKQRIRGFTNSMDALDRVSNAFTADRVSYLYINFACMLYIES